MTSSRLRVGFVPEHFSTPIHFAQKHYGLDAELIPFPSGTGHMITALRAGEIDVGIGLTEGWVAGLGKAQEAGDKDGGYRLIGTYVETPLCWAISTGAERPEIRTVDSLQGGKIGVSRIGSGSYVMGYVLAEERGWLVPTAGVGSDKEQAAPYSDIVVLNTFENLRKAVNSGEADFFMWEHFTSKRYYDKGEIRKIGEIYTPWSSWKIVASTRLIQGDGNPDAAVENLLKKLDQGIKHFNENKEEAVKYISTELDYSEEDAREWLKTVRFPERTRGVDAKVVIQTVETLCTAGVLKINSGVDASSMIAKQR
ncbi:periplasmic binding protein-like II [Thermothelomyces heterothallicus CBS 203.75]